MNNAELQKRIEQLEKQVSMLLDWQKMKEQQQLTFPIDKATKDQIIFAVANP